MTSVTKFSPAEEELLIEEIRKNRPIYDPVHHKYKDNAHKDDIWTDIGKTVGKSVDECKKKWKHIRDTHNRCKRKLGTRSASSAKKAWPIADRVSFLNMVENERRPQTYNEDVDTDDAESGSVSSLHGEDSPVIKHPKKEKLSDISTKRAEERSKIKQIIEEQNQQVLNTEKEDDIDLFFKSLALTVKKLPKIAINEAKIKALNVINEIELKYGDV